MAIATNDGKFALMCYNQPFQVILTQPTDPFDQGEKQGLMWQFPEILWEAPSVASPTIGGIMRNVMRITP